MLYLVMIKFLELKDHRIELFTSPSDAVAFAKAFLRQDCKDTSKLTETDKDDSLGLYYLGRDGTRMLITVYRKHIDCCKGE